MNLKWITNCYEDELNIYFSRGSKRMFLKRDPKPTNIHSVEELKEMGFVGIWEEVKDDVK